MRALVTWNWAAGKGQGGLSKGRRVPESGGIFGGLKAAGIGEGRGNFGICISW